MTDVRSTDVGFSMGFARNQLAITVSAIIEICFTLINYNNNKNSKNVFIFHNNDIEMYA